MLVIKNLFFMFMEILYCKILLMREHGSVAAWWFGYFEDDACNEKYPAIFMNVITESQWNGPRE